MSTQHLVILAGGRGTRLSPLTSNTSKSLVSVGQRPVIIQQIIGLDIDDVIVVVSPSSLASINDVLRRGLPSRFNVTYVMQDQPDGPQTAIALGVGHIPENHSAIVIFADTLVDWDPALHEGAWVGAHSAKSDRSWCYLYNSQWHDGIAPVLDPFAFIGLLRVEQVKQLQMIRPVQGDGMAEMLNELDAGAEYVKGWLDTGDLAALADARRNVFRSRATNRVRLTPYGTIVKSGCSKGQVHALVDHQSALYPYAFARTDNTVEMEFVTAPSLAELYLYGSPNVHAWSHILTTLIDACQNFLWFPDSPLLGDPVKMYVHKLRERSSGYVNRDDIDVLIERLASIIATYPERVTSIHGDLNFCNILYDVGSDVIRLIDPRGEWGDMSGMGDILYEAAKLRYSWRGFAAINHDVYGRRNDSAQVAVLDEILFESLLKPNGLTLSDCAAVEASLFWSAFPLHPPHHIEPLLEMGYECLREAFTSTI